ncbi:YndM family protein [Bacillus atrophaeus]|uniref:YndM family protein n=1 Tax=Bacillus atrophaeus TaxID=1452 RepID=UPI0022800C85|nr:YndM family protein [Bacillus atrophaeus]MCY8934218.1 YndM family protein [Bacillus atrophaeus]MCY8940817.1 YndM family protein [Bacillus atrophaeus]
MVHVKALAIKGIMTLIVLYLVLGLGFNFTFGDTLLMTIVLGVVSYLLGDLYVLPKWNNMIATVADFGLAFLVVWLMGMPLSMGLSPGMLALAALFTAIVMAIGEYFFHFYMMSKELGKPRFIERTE